MNAYFKIKFSRKKNYLYLVKYMHFTQNKFDV
jgi:hypothetical protein